MLDCSQRWKPSSGGSDHGRSTLIVDDEDQARARVKVIDNAAVRLELNYHSVVDALILEAIGIAGRGWRVHYFVLDQLLDLRLQQTRFA
jgi:hypothetical protein